MRNLTSVACWLMLTGWGMISPGDVRANEPNLPVLPKRASMRQLVTSLTFAIPEYPAKAVSEGVTGEVWLRMTLDAKGQPTHAVPVECSRKGYGFEECAVRMALSGRYLARSGVGTRRVPAFYQVKFRLFNGLVAVPQYSRAQDSLLPQGADVPDELRTAEPLSGCQQATIVLYPPIPLDSSVSLPEGEIWIWTRRRPASTSESRVVYTTLSDEKCIEAARMCISEYGFLQFDTLCDLKCEYARVAVRRDPPQYGRAPEGDTLFAAEGLVLASNWPVMIHSKDPNYPKAARKAGLSGTTWVKSLVNAAGFVEQAEVFKSCGTPSLDSAAVNAAYGCEFLPRIFHGRPACCWVAYRVEFKQREN